MTPDQQLHVAQRVAFGERCAAWVRRYGMSVFAQRFGKAHNTLYTIADGTCKPVGLTHAQVREIQRHVPRVQRVMALWRPNSKRHLQEEFDLTRNQLDAIIEAHAHLVRSPPPEVTFEATPVERFLQQPAPESVLLKRQFDSYY